MTKHEISIVKIMLASSWKEGYMRSETKGYDPFKECSIESYESQSKMCFIAYTKAKEAYDNYGKHYVENLMNSVAFDDEFPS